jgi:hypothetical protein
MFDMESQGLAPLAFLFFEPLRLKGCTKSTRRVMTFQADEVKKS